MTKEKALSVRPSGRRGLTVQQIAAVIAPCRGNVSEMARRLGVSRNTLYNKIKASPRLQAKLTAARDERIDAAESALDAAVDRGEPWAVQLLLRTLGRARGYGDEARLDLAHTVEVNIGFAAADRDESEK